MTLPPRPSDAFDRHTVWYDMMEKFPTYRPHQAETAERVIDSPKKVVIVIGPPGFGKSPMAVVACGLAHARLRWRSLICTKTINLQRQYEDEFGMAVMMGRGNYDCVAEYAPTAASAPCLYNFRCDDKDVCHYYVARYEAAASPLVMVNYDLLAMGWPGHGNPTSPLNKRQLIIGDEAHLMDASLRNAAGVTISNLSQRRLKDVGYPLLSAVVQDAPAWKQWALGLRHHLEPYILEARHIQEEKRDVDRGRFPQLAGPLALDVLAQKLIKLINQDTPIAIMREDREVRVMPIYADIPFHDILKDVEKVVLMSATLPAPDIYASMLGLSEREYEVIEVPSEFPASQRPLYIYPVCKVGWKMSEEDVDDLARAMDSYLERWSDRKVLVHTGSYQLQERVLSRSGTQHARRVTHGPRGIAEAIQRFRQAEAGAVLFSPTARVGVDLPGDDLRGQLILKLPFPDRRDPVVRAREELVPDSYAQATAADLMQMYGRGMRYKEDWCDTILLDAHFTWFYKRHARMLPRYFKEALRW